MKRLPVIFVIVLLAACAPRLAPPGPAVTEPRLEMGGEAGAFIAADGAKLPLKAWLPKDGKPSAVILALHGFNDYSNFFDEPGTFLAQRGLASYAYDQRGFGGTAQPGTWAGVEAYGRDLAAVAGKLRARHPGVPFYILGESMGGAVVMVTMTGPLAPQVDGVILSAPAVWGRATMPWYQRWTLWVGAHTVPWMTVTGRGLKIVPSDNYEMLVELGRDPLVIKETRIGSIYGLANLMDAALASAPALHTPALILYGERDEIIPKLPTKMMLERLPDARPAHRRVALYEGGYHMLLRDLPAATVWKDIQGWIADKSAPLRSKADQRDVQKLLAGKRAKGG